MAADVPESLETHHALLALWGHFAQAIGLIDALLTVPLPQKTCQHAPQTKLLEFLLAILAGLPYLKDLSAAAHPLDQDAVLAHAWGQPGWADSSGVCRTLQALTAADVAQIVAVLAQVSRPFLAEEVVLALRQGGRLVFDADLTGRPVGKQSTTYPGATFGHMDDTIQFGYQAALVSLESPTYGRLCLSATQHPGHTHACTQLPALVAAAEAATGTHPRRRTDLLRQRLATLAQTLAHHQTLLTHQQARLAQTEAALQRADQQVQERQQALARAQQPRVGRRGATARGRQLAEQRLDRALVRQRRSAALVATTQRGLQHHAHALAPLQAAEQVLRQRLAAFELDNARAPSPVPAVMRMDAGFATAENLALLIEMGYEVYTKPCTPQMMTAALRQLPADAAWVPVDAANEMRSGSSALVGTCPYALDIAVRRPRQPDPGGRSCTLLHYGADPVRSNLAAWLATYNARQTVEAGIKEGKQVFQMHHLKVRQAPALQLQEYLAAFAANFVRWAAAWLAQGPIPTPVRTAGIKAQVQVLAHTSATLTLDADGWRVHFSPQSVLAGTTLTAPPVAIQWPLPLYETRVFAPV